MLRITPEHGTFRVARQVTFDARRRFPRTAGGLGCSATISVTGRRGHRGQRYRPAELLGREAAIRKRRGARGSFAELSPEFILRSGSGRHKITSSGLVTSTIAHTGI